MKKFLSIVLTVAIAATALVGCGSKPSDNNSEGNTSNGTLKVATSPDFAPMEFIDLTKKGQDKFVGFDIEMAKYIASELGMGIEFMPMSFDACQIAVSTGKADLGLAGFSWTEEREKNYNISDYYQAGENETEQVVIMLKENEGKYKNVEEFNGVKVGVQAASLQEELCKAQLTGSQPVTIGDINTGILQLKKGDFECMVVASGNADVIIASNPEIIKSEFEFKIDPKYTDNVILLKKGNDELTHKVNKILAQAKEQGLYEKWYNEALETAGVAVSYDDDGKIVEEENNDSQPEENSSKENK